MEWKREYLDLFCVPAGMLLLVFHHAQLFYRVWKFPSTTSIGINQSRQRVWMMSVMQDPQKHAIIIVQTLRNPMMASTVLATASLTICSVIAVMVSKNSSRPHENMVLGAKRGITTSIKLSSILVCFLVALIANVQSVRYYCHLSVLLNIPEATAPAGHSYCVDQVFGRASFYWAIGLRSFYFSLPMFLWMFGPLPMFTCAVITLIFLRISDNTVENSQGKVCQHSIGKGVDQV